MLLDFATLTSIKKVRNLQHENLPIQDINFPTKNSKSPDLGSRMYHMYDVTLGPVQSIVSLTTSLRRQLVKYMPTKLSNTVIIPLQTVLVGGYTVYMVSVRPSDRECILNILFP